MGRRFLVVVERGPFIYRILCDRDGCEEELVWEFTEDECVRVLAYNGHVMSVERIVCNDYDCEIAERRVFLKKRAPRGLEEDFARIVELILDSSCICKQER